MNNKLTSTKQDINKVSFAPTLKKEDGFLNFRESTIIKIENKIKALDPWPGTYCFINNQRLKIFEIEKLHRNLLPGETSIEHGHLAVGVLDGVVRLSSIQIEGKKICTDTEFLNGLKNKDGPILLNP